MFKWDEKYSVGISIIDDQHKNIFALGEEMESIITDYNGEEIQSKLDYVFQQLIDYTDYHFNYEEQLLEKAKYKELESHRLKHESIIETLNIIELATITNKQSTVAFTLLQLIAEWIFEHIQGDDFSYISCLRKKLEL